MRRKIKPTQKQLAYQKWEFGLFIHFGLRSFYEGYVDFDEREMSPAQFNPVHLDCEQWIKTAKEAGMKYAVLTAKHHDGFSNWPSDYTNFSVKESPWRNGRGDVVREYVDACRKYGIKPGLYYSPYDGASDFYKNKSFKEYDDYFIHQITELLTNYGEIDIIWFDGAGSEGHTYDWGRIIPIIRSLQPNILLFNIADPDFRWVGNEDGLAPIPSWNAVQELDFSIYVDELETLTEPLWLPAECDVQMRANWFYSEHDEQTIKSLDELMGIYYYSVGRGTNLLLNIGPNREGLLPEKDAARLKEFGEEIQKRFKSPLVKMKDFKACGGKWQYTATNPHLIDHIVIQEDLANGESVKAFQISILTAKTKRLLPIYKGENIGNKAIIQVPAVNVSGIILEIVESDGKAEIGDIEVYYVGGK